MLSEEESVISVKRTLLLILLPVLLAEPLAAQRLAQPRPEQPTTVLSYPTLTVPLDSAAAWTSDDEGRYSTGMVWRDFNRDGQVDVFFANGNDMARARNTAYYLQAWQLPPVPTWFSNNSEYSGHCAAGDINDDGFIDVVVANFLGLNRFASPGRPNLYLNMNGLLGGSPSWLSADSFYSFSCALGDVDNDGDLDLAVATGEPYNSILEPDRLYINDNGAFQSLPAWQSEALTAAMDVIWGDVDNDGDLDLALCYDNLPAAVYVNTGGSLATVPGWQAAVNEPANTLLFGDVNNDGWLDLLVAYNDQLGGGGFFMAYLNDGAGTLHTAPDWISSDGGFGSALALYDYDLDGDLDLAAGRWFDRPRVYENLGGTFSPNPVWRANKATTAEEMAWTDVDASGAQSLADTIVADGRRLLYAAHAPWYLLDSVVVDGDRLLNPEFCFDPVAGWVSLAATPTVSTIIYYQYSFTADLAVANWDLGNDVYLNTSEHYVNFTADARVGWAPFTVQFFDHTNDAIFSSWSFGDGGTAFIRDPVHTYDAPGSYDVTLSVLKATGSFSRTSRNFIIALADTLTFGIDSVYPGEPIMIPVHLTNTLPLYDLMLPITVADLPIDITLDSVRRGQRTLAFNPPGFVTFVHGSDRYDLTLELTAGAAGYLPPGSGEILRLYATVNWNAPVGTANAVDTMANGTYDLAVASPLLTYQPRVGVGQLRSRFVARGDINGDSRFNLTDLTRLVNYLFLGGARPPAGVACDVNGDAQHNLTDLTYLVNYLFLGGPPPPPYP